MERVWMLEPDVNRYESLTEPEDIGDAEAERRLKSLIQLDDGALPAKWKSPRFEVDGDRRHPPADIVGCFGFQVALSPRAVEALRPFVEQSGRVVRLDCPSREYYALVVTRVTAAFDTGRSKIVWVPEVEVAEDIRKYVFDPKRFGDEAAFRLPVRGISMTYVRKPFVDAVRKHGLTGARFEEVWASSSN